MRDLLPEYHPPVFVTLEGPEGAGKTTLIRALADVLERRGESVVVTREPGAGAVGNRIRQILLNGHELDPRTELLLFLADRAQHVAELIRPALDQGKTVLCDRFTDSTVAYQGYGRGFDIAALKEWNTFATGDLEPDLTLLLDLDPKIGLSRLQSTDRIDAEPLDFHQKVRKGFLAEAAEGGRWKILDASRSTEEVRAEALAALDSLAPKPAQYFLP